VQGVHLVLRRGRHLERERADHHGGGGTSVVPRRAWQSLLVHVRTRSSLAECLDTVAVVSCVSSLPLALSTFPCRDQLQGRPDRSEVGAKTVVGKRAVHGDRYHLTRSAVGC
jgi:hypothetical protein